MSFETLKVKVTLGLNIFYSEISTEITHCTHSNKDQNESKYLLSSSPRRSHLKVQ